MSEQKTLRHIKAGDQVFVVWQTSRWRTEHKTGLETVVRVGRKYGYINQYSKESPFCLNTGYSIDPRDSNARANGYGFDVYASEHDYRTSEHHKARKSSLQKRLVRSYGALIDLPSDAVEKIHQVLDEIGTPSGDAN